ncbi:hypothetical protein ICW40_15550 [Actinotalea ferrariae]|uniref:hypothetical protein n=1 Tax=Actinotalea ferrariae TaxID=1386098 RepID=UPI001C8B6754|nr:hypothetical protein [Actinotalea ferrariae]MBX9246212.1 hypothetical protein [Actinotalea ferrariae]
MSADAAAQASRGDVETVRVADVIAAALQLPGAVPVQVRRPGGRVEGKDAR